MKLHKLIFLFSVHQLGIQRVKFQHKICFKKDISYLRLKSTPSISLTGRLFRDGNFLRLYKQLQKAFLNNLLPVINKLPYNNEFKSMFNQYQSFKDINRVLFWKISTVNTLFNLKKLKNRKIIYYLNPEKRVVLVMLWLKNIIKLRKKNDHNCSKELFKPVFNFICSNRNVNEIFSLKLKIYKIRLSRG